MYFDTQDRRPGGTLTKRRKESVDPGFPAFTFDQYRSGRLVLYPSGYAVP
jgi:hypothetical protein